MFILEQVKNIVWILIYFVRIYTATTIPLQKTDCFKKAEIQEQITL